MIIAFVDDNQNEQMHTKNLFIDAFSTMGISITKIDCFYSGESFLKNWHPERYDLIILDILMGNISGIDVAKEIRKYNKDVCIVFCSNSNEYAYESYLLDTSYYIQKPVTFESINQMITRLNVKDFESRRFIVLPNNERLILRNMLYARYSNHKISIILKDSTEISFWSSLHEFMTLLEPYHFLIQCNKGYVINLHEVISWHKDFFTLSNKEEIPISRKRQNETKDRYHQFLFHTLRKDVV